MPWMLGSAAVFGTAGAFLIMSTSGSQSHAKHAVEHGTTHMHEYHSSDDKPKLPADAVKNPTTVGEADKPAPAASGDDEATSGKSAELASIQRSLNTDAPAQAQHSEMQGKNQADEPVQSMGEEEAKDESAPVPAGEPEEGRKAEDIPTEEIKESIVQAVHIGAPKVAMAEEVAASKE